MRENTIKIPHPEFGLVVFTEMTLRQMDVLNDYMKIKKFKKKNESNKQNKITSKSGTTVGALHW